MRPLKQLEPSPASVSAVLKLHPRSAMSENPLLENPASLKRLAKYMVQRCSSASGTRSWRTTILERFQTPGPATIPMSW